MEADKLILMSTCDGIRSGGDHIVFSRVPGLRIGNFRDILVTRGATAITRKGFLDNSSMTMGQLRMSQCHRYPFVGLSKNIRKKT